MLITLVGMLSRRLVIALPVAAVVAGCGAQARAAELLRVNQVGYISGEPKLARLMTSAPARGASFEVTDAAGAVVLRGRAGADLGRWNRAFAHVYRLDLSALTAPGSYTLRVGRSRAALTVAGAAALYQPLVARELAFLRAQRDGPNVDGSILGRGPSHLADAAALEYRTPVYRRGRLVGGLHRVGGPVDVAGGWMDAGDTLKFAETASFTEVLLEDALLRTPAAFGPSLDAGRAEARFGLDWLLKLWDPARARLVYQVGIGDGNARIEGAHDTTWRRPEADDALRAAPGSYDHYVKYRPAFVTGPRISPNLAGRMAAAYALGAQLFAASDPAYSARALAAAESIYAHARTHNVGQLVTSVPHAYYPELEWRDDMELGAVAIADARHALGQGVGAYVAAAANWADSYAASLRNGTDSLNLYDVAALAHERLAADLAREGASGPSNVSRASMATDLRDQLRSRQRRDPFGALWAYRDDDVVAHALGATVESGIANTLGAGGVGPALARTQRDWVLGENAWGTSFVVGAGARFPRCLHHPLANLAGSLNGAAPLLAGAVVPGPVASGELRHLSLPRGYRACPAGGGDPFARFTGFGASYADRVASSPTVEPSIDLAALALLAFARQAAG